MSRLKRHSSFALGILLLLAPVTGQERTSNQRELRAASRRASDRLFVLEYSMTRGEQLAYEVEHLVKVETTIQGNTQRTQSRSASAKLWKVSDVDPQNGQITFTHEILYVDMWNETQDREPTRYDSRLGEPPSAEFEQVADSIGKPIATVTVDRTGRVVKRADELRRHDLGTGGLLVPLPAGPVSLNAEWSVLAGVPVRLEDGTFKTIKTRQVYKLERVDTGVATISLRTQVLTPSIDERMQSQLMQKLTNGTIRFDLDAGRVISRRLEWDEDVVGFNGPSSSMSYLARLTESLTAEPKLARQR